MTPDTPRSRGFRMPAEWEPQESVWLSWPTNTETWPGETLAQVRRAYVEVIAALAPAQGVSLLVDGAPDEAEARKALGAAGIDLRQVRCFPIPTIDAWIRDYGPTFVLNEAGQLAMVRWVFNAWGGKYDDLKADDGIPERINRYLELPIFEAGIVLEGGSIEVNGRGTALTTEQCLLSPNRNPSLDRARLEQYLEEFLGAPNVVWLSGGIAGDDTDGHIDDIARFVDSRTVLCAVEEDPSDANFEVLKDGFERLRAAKDERGRSFEVRKLPMPDPVSVPGGRLPASYANFYIGNEVVIVPVFGQEKDRQALRAIQDCFPNRRVTGVESTAMVLGLGAIHCCSQQQPVGLY